MVHDYRDRYQAMINKLKEGNHKLTPQRLAIIRILAGSEDHPSVEDIYYLLHRRFPGISQATVYRNIMLIKSLGEVLEIGFAGGSTRYDGIKPYPHPHVICLKCNKIVDPDLDSLQDMTKEITDESGFEIVTYRLDFFGVCPECRTKG
jgi:Fur family transcriptional regulator, peroxide stress response regulator